MSKLEETVSNITQDEKTGIAKVKKEPRVGPGWIEVTLAPERRCLLLTRVVGGVLEGLNASTHLVFEDRRPLRVEHTYDEVRSALFKAQALAALEDDTARAKTAERFAQALDELDKEAEAEADGFEEPT